MARSPTLSKAAAISAIAGSIGMLLGAFALEWWTTQGVSIDLRGMEMCLEGVCRSRPLSSVGQGSEMWAKLATATWSAGIGASILSIAAAITALVGRSPRSLGFSAGVLCLFGLLLAGGTYYMHPELGELSPGLGVAAFVAGAGLGEIAAWVLATTPPSTKL